MTEAVDQDMSAAFEATAAHDRAGRPGGTSYFAARRAMVDPFIRTHFSWRGTRHLHRAALGWDILRAPFNALLSPVLVLARLAALLCRRMGLSALAGWLSGRRILLRTAVSHRVETLIATDLLGLTLPQGGSVSHPDDILAAVPASSPLHEMIGAHKDALQARARARHISDALSDYAGTRSAVAEMTTGILALAIGAMLFRALTPGMMSMAPGIADAVARSTAIAQFPMGETMGGLWYGLFPTDASATLIMASLAILVMTGSVVAAFAGLLADPVQSRLGIHRRRLMRLIDTLEAELCGTGPRPFAAREHYYARFLDLWDMVGSIFRFFRT